MKFSHTAVRALLIVCIAQLLNAEATAQTQQDSSKATPRTTVTILTDIDSSVVFIDDERRGLTPLSLHDLTPGIHQLVLQPPDVESWLANSISDEIRIIADQPMTFRYKFDRRYLIRSVPFDAEILIADSVVGKTPLTLSSGNALSFGTKTQIGIRKQGFEPETFDLTDANNGVLSIALKKKWNGIDDQEEILRSTNGQVSKPLRLSLTIAGTVLSGTAAAYFKIKADDRYIEYRRSGSPQLLAQSQRLDTAAAVALVATQIGLGLLTYFVLSD